MEVEHGGKTQTSGCGVDHAVHALVKFSAGVDGVAHGGVLEELFCEADDEDGPQDVDPGAPVEPVSHLEEVFDDGQGHRAGEQRPQDEDA